MQVTSSVNSALYSGAEGLQKAERQAEDAALQINRLQTEQQKVSEQPATDNQANANSGNQTQSQPVSLTTEVVNLAVSEHLAKASANVIRTADDMMGTLIDTKV